MQHDIAAASDEACGVYYEKTPVEELSATALREAMTLASQASVKEKKTDYEKLLSIANPKHGPHILAEV